VRLKGLLEYAIQPAYMQMNGDLAMIGRARCRHPPVAHKPPEADDIR